MYVYHVHHIGYYKLLSIVGITWQDAPVSQYAALLQDYKVRDAPLYQSCSFFYIVQKEGWGAKLMFNKKVGGLKGLLNNFQKLQDW